MEATGFMGTIVQILFERLPFSFIFIPLIASFICTWHVGRIFPTALESIIIAGIASGINMLPHIDYSRTDTCGGPRVTLTATK